MNGPKNDEVTHIRYEFYIFILCYKGMAVKASHIAHSDKVRERRRALIRSIADKAFWSYPSVAPSKVPDGKLIEKVLTHGSDAERKKLFSIFPYEKIQRVWEQKLVVQEPRYYTA